MAPESLRAGHFSAASDVYALGVTLWEALEACEPFPALAPVKAARYVLAGGALPPLSPQALQTLEESGVRGARGGAGGSAGGSAGAGAGAGRAYDAELKQEGGAYDAALSSPPPFSSSSSSSSAYDRSGLENNGSGGSSGQYVDGAEALEEQEGSEAGLLLWRDELQRLVQRCTAFESAQRPAAEEVHRQLWRVLDAVLAEEQQAQQQQ